MDTQKKLVVLRDQWTGCTKCTLSKLRSDSRIIFGQGSYNADFLVVMEAPNVEDVEQEALLGGDPGQLVYDILERSGIEARNVFFTSVVACRPYVVIPETEDAQERTQDRDPDKTEVEACLPRLHELIYLVDPRLILAMGDTSWRALVANKNRGRHKKIATAAGELFDAWVPGRLRAVRYPVMVTMSPKQLIANPSAAAHGPISTTIEAFMKALRYVTLLKKEESK